MISKEMGKGARLGLSLFYEIVDKRTGGLIHILQDIPIVSGLHKGFIALTHDLKGLENVKKSKTK